MAIEDAVDTATTAADSSPPPKMIVPSPQRGQKRGRGAQDDGEAGDTGAARGLPRLVAGIYYDAVVEESEEEACMEAMGENNEEEEVDVAKGLIDFLGGIDGNHGGDSDDAKAKAGYSCVPDQDPVDAAAAAPRRAVGVAAALDYYEHGGRALCDFLLPPSPIHYHYPVHPAAYDTFYADDASYRFYGGDASYRFCGDATAYPSYLDDAAYPLYGDVIDGYAGAAAGYNYNTFAATVFAGDAPNPSPSSGPLGFDFNQQPDDAGFLVVPDDAAGDASAAAAGGAVELAADDATTARASSSGLDFDLNQPCPSEFPDDGASDDTSDVTPDPAPAPAEDGLAVADGASDDTSDVPPDPAPAPAEESLSVAGPDVDEQPELPDGGAPPVSPTRRRQPLGGRLWGWAFGWANGLARSRR